MQAFSSVRRSRRQSFWLLPGAAAAFLGWTVARADVLTLSAPPGQGVQLRLQGAANKDYAIQTTASLTGGPWVTLSTGASDAAGGFQSSDAAASGARFYRAARLPDLQTATTAAATVPGSPVTVLLDGSDPLHSGGPLAAVITQLPTGGTLEQTDGTPITAVGTVVTDARNRVRFIPAAGTADPGGDAFGYLLRRTSDGVTSAPQVVAVSFAPNWVYSSFDDSTQRLRLAYSLDGLSWTQTDDLYTPPVGNNVRDSSIVHLNGAYYVAYTAGNFGFAEYVQICRSTDLVHWTYLCNVDTAAPGAINYSWAPEWFVDHDGSVYLFLCREMAGGVWRIFWTRPADASFTAWNPIQMVGGDMAYRGAIDPKVVRDGGTYYLLYRNYGSAGSSDYIEMAVGTSPTNFTLLKTGNWAGWGTPREGPSLVHLGAARWRCYFVLADNSLVLNGSHVACSESSDGMATWTAPFGVNVPQHGTCLALP